MHIVLIVRGRAGHVVLLLLLLWQVIVDVAFVVVMLLTENRGEILTGAMNYLLPTCIRIFTIVSNVTHFLFSLFL